MNTTLRLATLVILVSGAVTARAELIAWDSFATASGAGDYNIASLQFQSPTTGLDGFSGRWDGSGDTTSALVATSGGLTHPLSPGTPLEGRLQPYFSDVGTANRRLSRAIDYVPVDGNYYMSLLLQKTAVASGDLLAGLSPFEAVRWSYSDIQGTHLGIGGIGSTSGSIAFFTTGTFDIVVPTQEVNVGETYFALMQFDYSLSAPDNVTVSIYDGSSNRISSNTYNNLNLDGDIGRFGVLTSETAPTAFVDELRFGTELSDVMFLPGLQGDYNDDDRVNMADYTVWRDNLVPASRCFQQAA